MQIVKHRGDKMASFRKRIIYDSWPQGYIWRFVTSPFYVYVTDFHYWGA